MRKKSKIVQTCCGGIPIVNGRCPVCNSNFEDEDVKVLRLPRKRKKKIIAKPLVPAFR